MLDQQDAQPPADQNGDRVAHVRAPSAGPGEIPGAPRPFSMQAVASIIASAVLCCPFTSIIGMVLGWRALRAIGRSGGAIRGRRVAIAGILIGGLSLIGQLALIDFYTGHLDRFQRQGTQRLIASVFATPDQNADDVWTRPSARRLRGGRAAAFVADLEQRFGRLRRAAVQPPFRRAGDSPYQYTVPVAWEFEDRTLLGSATIQLGPSGLDPLGHIDLVEIIISDPDRENLHLPPRPE